MTGERIEFLSPVYFVERAETIIKRGACVITIEEAQQENRKYLKGNCSQCFGLCCIALYFSAKEGFPENKKAGQPCKHMQEDFRCNIHGKLIPSGMKGCVAYDCYGAGQQLSQLTYKGENWREYPDHSNQMFLTFLIMRQFHEMCWYLLDAYQIADLKEVRVEIEEMFNLIQSRIQLLPEELLVQDMDSHWANICDLLKRVSLLARGTEYQTLKLPFKQKNIMGNRLDLSGKNLKEIDLKNADLKGAFLIASDLQNQNLYQTDLFGADFRDAKLQGADLSKSIYVTQSQMNTAIGDPNTKLPKYLDYPVSWSEK